MSYVYRATEEFWRNFYQLPNRQKTSARTVWEIFKKDPFHPSLRTHKIHSLSARLGETVHSSWIEGDLRVVFTIRGNTVYTLDIGTHKIYQ